MWTVIIRIILSLVLVGLIWNETGFFTAFAIFLIIANIEINIFIDKRRREIK